jgi:hypothetical protein
MKKALLALAIVAAGISTFAQGQIDFINRNIGTRADPQVLYHVPIFVAGGRATGTGAGNLPGGVTVGLFEAGSNTPLVSTPLRTGTPAAGAVFRDTLTATTSSPAGTTPTLIVRAWQGASFDAARNSTTLQWGEWSFTPNQLGGTPPGGGLPIATPGMTGWGPEDGTGFELTIVPEPSTIALGALGIGALLLRRRKK